MFCFVIIEFLINVIFVVSLRDEDTIFYNNSGIVARHGACRLRSVREAGDPPSASSMTESFVLDDIEYKLCRYHVTWDEALVYCSTHKAHLATLDNNEKTSFVAQAIASSSSSVAEDYWIGARKYYGGLWTWDSSARRLGSETDIIGNIPIRYPSDQTDDVHCLTIDRTGHDSAIFVPRSCTQRRGFICQRDNARAYDNKLRMVVASRIGEQEFRLYAGRATWAEAVVQCRQEGLQIGEVNTIEEAQALAVSMLRNRPEGIESAWIGGYTRHNDPDTWRWLASGEKIEDSEMWRRNLTESSGGCLLLDRHLCETPVFVEIMCDRKRDVWCQKPPKKHFTKKPVEVIVDGCLYWIGFYPMKWSDARRSCQSVNASLVVLDSPKTIAHVMSLMLDNRAELRHIWADGRRKGRYGQWRWEINGEAIPGFGQSFIPWCSDDNIYTNETNCLNVDRENVDTPLVYGLSCSERQPYICQPRVGDCVFHSTAAPVIVTDLLHSETSEVTQFETPSSFYDKTKILGGKKTTVGKFVTTPSFYVNTDTLGQSKITGTYPTIMDIHERMTTSIDDFHDDMILHWEPGESITSKNSSTGHQRVNYQKPFFSGFTLPAFPQFGIKFASAHETKTQSLLNYDNRRTRKIKQHSTTAHPSKMAALSAIVGPTKKPLFEPRKDSHDIVQFFNFSSSPTQPVGNVESTISANSKTARIRNEKSQIINPKLSSWDEKSFLKIGKIANLPEITLSSRDNERTRKYSIKTTRDLDSNVTEIPLNISTTIIPDMASTRIDENMTENSTFEITREAKFKKILPKTLIRITTPLAKKGKKNRSTTELTTPYDAIDSDYYEIYDTKKNANTDKDESFVTDEFDDYEENYDLPEKSKGKKKIKQTSTSSIRKGYTTLRTTQRQKTTRKKKKNVKSTIPIAEELSKNLQMALVSMLEKGVHTRRMEKTAELQKSTTTEVTKNFSPEKYADFININKPLKANINEKYSPLSPYYAFEGPMIVELSDDSNSGTNEHIEFGGKVRKFTFLDNKGNNPLMGQFEGRRYHNNDNNRRTKYRDLSNEKKTANNGPMGISALPSVNQNDPNSLIQMGRYFKNKFGNIVNRGGGLPEKSSREISEEYPKYERHEKARWPPGRFRSQTRNRGYRTKADYSLRRNNGQRWPENLNNYDSTRRLYPRGYSDNLAPLFLPQNIDNLESWQREQEFKKLTASWPDGNLTNGKYLNFDEFVSPRNFPAPIRTTRSFNDDSQKTNRKKMAEFPDFKISKLIKEVKIDLDQRLLRNYLETFAKKIVRTDNGRYKKDDWKDTWRYLLVQMSKFLDRMNINVNGDVMKLQIGDYPTKKIRNIDMVKKIDWRRKKKIKNLELMRDNLRKKILKINETSRSRNSSKLMEDRRVLSNIYDEKSSLDKKIMKNNIFTKNYESTDNSEINSFVNSVSLGKKIINNSQTGSAANYDEKIIDDSRNFFSNRYDVSARNFDIEKLNFRRLRDEEKMKNWYQTKLTNFNNSRILVAPAIIPTSRISRIYTYQPMVQQLPNKISFTQGSSQLDPTIKTMNDLSQKSSILNGEYLPKGTLSRIVGSQYKNHHFDDKIIDKDSFNSTNRVKNYSNFRGENSTMDDENQYVKNVEKNNDQKFENFLDKHDDFENRYFNYYANDNDTNVDKIEDDFTDGDNEDFDIDSRQNFAPKILLSSSHRLGKAMELSNFRKFQRTSMPTKNLVTRSLRSDEIFEKSTDSKKREILKKKYSRDDMVRNLENMNQEPSTVSLRMIMSPDNNYPRVSRQSYDDLKNFKNPAQTIKLMLNFYGNENEKTMEKKIFLPNNKILPNVFRSNNGNFSTSQNFMGNSTNKYFGRSKKLPIGFVDKIRRRAMINKLREKNRKFIEKDYHPISWKSESVGKVENSLDRKSRTVKIGKNGENSKNLFEKNKFKNFDGTGRKFEKNNFTAKRHFTRQGNGAGYDGQENSGQMTLYVDLTLGKDDKKFTKRGS